LILSRIINLLFALVLIAALVIALDPQARAKAIETVRSWQPELQQMDDKVVVNIPSFGTPGPTATPLSTVTPADQDQQIPVTGDNDTDTAPIIQVNWDALGNALRNFWVRLSQVKVEFNTTPPKDTK
jgi:hypothetical protein